MGFRIPGLLWGLVVWLWALCWQALAADESCSWTSALWPCSLQSALGALLCCALSTRGALLPGVCATPQSTWGNYVGQLQSKMPCFSGLGAREYQHSLAGRCPWAVSLAPL